MSKVISTPIAIIIIIICAVLVGGFAVWQYLEMPKEEIKSPELKISEQEKPAKITETIPPQTKETQEEPQKEIQYVECSTDEDCPPVDKLGWACYSYCEESKCNFKCKQYSASISDTAFLFSSFEDISNYRDVYYHVDAENYLFYTPKLYDEISGKVIGSKNVFCFLDMPDCQEKLNELKSYFEELKTLIKNAEPVTCSPWETRETGFHSDIYKNHLVVKISNDDRNPRDSFDYSLEVDFIVGGKEKNSYSIDLRIGDHYCYKGQVEEALLDDFSEKLSNFIHSFYKT